MSKPPYVVVFGGNSYADEISANGQSLSLAQSSACTSSSGKFMGGLEEVNSASGTLGNICIYGDTVSGGGGAGAFSYTMFAMPTGFPSIGTPVSEAFAAPEGCFWEEKTASATYYKLKQES